MVVGISENEETSCKNRLCLCVCVLLRSIQWRLVCGCDLRSSMWPATNHDSLFGCPSFLFLMVMLVAANFGLQDPWRPTKQLVRGCQIAVLMVVVGSLQSMGPPQHYQSVVFCKRWVFETSISVAWYERLFTNAKREQEQQRCQFHILSPPISSFSCSS